jgi:hypothetical protein
VGEPEAVSPAPLSVSMLGSVGVRTRAFAGGSLAAIL